MNGKRIHRTDPIDDTVDPIWILENGSLFLLQMSPEEFFSCSSGMFFVVKDYKFSGSSTLGHVHVSLNSLLRAKGERVAYDIELHEGTKKSQLYLRIKEADESDISVRASFSMTGHSLDRSTCLPALFRRK